MATKKLNSEARSGAALESPGRRSRRSAHGSEMIAEWLLEVEGAIEDGEKGLLSAYEGLHLTFLHDNRDRLRRILDAIQQARGGRKPTA